jgi:hypothetical protein
LEPSSSRILGYYRVALRFCLVEFEVAMLQKQNDVLGFAEKVSKGMAVLRYIVEELAPAQTLHFIPDLITLQAARVGIFLVKASGRDATSRHKRLTATSTLRRQCLPNLEPDEVANIINLFRSMVVVCQAAAKGEDTASYQARFFSSLLSVDDCTRSTATSRAHSPSVANPRMPGAHAVHPCADAGTSGLNGLAVATGMGGPSGGNDAVIADPNQVTLEDILQDASDWWVLSLLGPSACQRSRPNRRTVDARRFSFDVQGHCLDPCWDSF